MRLIQLKRLTKATLASPFTGELSCVGRLLSQPCFPIESGVFGHKPNRGWGAVRLSALRIIAHLNRVLGSSRTAAWGEKDDQTLLQPNAA